MIVSGVLHGRDPIGDVFVPRHILVAIGILVEHQAVILHLPGDAGLFGCDRVGELAQRTLGLGAREQVTRQTAGALVPGGGIRIGQHLAQLFLGSRSGGR